MGGGNQKNHPGQRGVRAAKGKLKDFGFKAREGFKQLV